MARSHWRFILGALSTLYGLGRAVLDAIGYVDLVIAHHNSPTETWLGKLMAYLFAPPSWSIFPLVLAGLGFIWWDLKRPGKIVRNIHHIDHREEAQAIDTTHAIVTKSHAHELSPDWSIRALVFHIKPHVLETSEQNEFEAVFGEIVDKFSTGQLKCWGRRINYSDRLPLRLIDPNDWQHLKLISWLLDEDGGKVLQADRRRHNSPVAQYTDLQVNQAQAVSIWPERNRQSIYMSAFEAIHFLTDETAWAVAKKAEITPEGLHKNVGLEAFIEFQDKAKNGGVTVLGRFNGLGGHVEIPSTYWLSAWIDPVSTLSGGRSRTSATVPLGAGIPIYEDLQIARADVLRTWRHAPEA